MNPAPARIIAARRSAFCTTGGAFAALTPEALALPLIEALLADAGVSRDQVDGVILGNALGAGGNPARRLALLAGMERVAGLTIDRQCTSGLDAILLAKAMVEAGQARIVIAGGAESHSQRPHRAHRTKAGPIPYEQAPFTPWPDRDPDMTLAAFRLADRLGISRTEQDDWAAGSHRRALAQADWPEIVPILGQARDPYARAPGPALMARARVLAGSVTVANTAPAADGAALALVVCDKVARGRGFAFEGLSLGADPQEPGLAPVGAIAALLARRGLAPEALERCELMEAYAAQAIACVRGAGLDPVRVNPRGGALSRGHPIGASGAHLVAALFHHLGSGAGLAAIAGAGGIGTALVMARDLG